MKIFKKMNQFELIHDICNKMYKIRKYSANTFRVFFYILSLSKIENFVSIDVKTIAENINITEISVIRATKQLCADNILKKVPHTSDKRRIDYLINPMVEWKV